MLSLNVDGGGDGGNGGSSSATTPMVDIDRSIMLSADVCVCVRCNSTNCENVLHRISLIYANNKFLYAVLAPFATHILPRNGLPVLYGVRYNGDGKMRPHAVVQQAVSYILLILSWQSEWSRVKRRCHCSQSHRTKWNIYYNLCVFD